ncbi:sugar transporter, partial [Thioclava sp. BHET1]
MSPSSTRPPAWAFTAFLALGLSGCGIAYQSPSVSSLTSDGSKVRVVPITAESVMVANRAPYTPLPVPAAFSSTAGTSASNIAQGGTPPDGVVGSISPPVQMQTRLPPKVTPGPYKIGVGDVLLLATQSGSSVAELSGLLAAQN